MDSIETPKNEVLHRPRALWKSVPHELRNIGVRSTGRTSKKHLCRYAQRSLRSWLEISERARGFIGILDHAKSIGSVPNSNGRRPTCQGKDNGLPPKQSIEASPMRQVASARKTPVSKAPMHASLPLPPCRRTAGSIDLGSSATTKRTPY